MGMKLEEIARLAGVSLATASYALSGKGTVSAATRQRVREIAEKCGYEPNAAARSLSTGDVPLVGVASALLEGGLVSPTETPVLSGLGQVLAENGIEMVLFTTANASGVPTLLARRAVSGAVFMVRRHALLGEWLRARSIPCVAVNLGPVETMDAVRPDDDDGVHQAVEHLAELGHRRIAYINTDVSPGEGHPPSIESRQRSFLKTMAERELAASPGTELRQPPAARVAALLDGDAPPSAFVCYNDDEAAVVIGYLRERGFHVPRDFSVVGIDDVGLGEMIAPSLTSVHSPYEEMGRTAGELLLARIAQPDRPFQDVLLPQRLVPRESAGDVARTRARKQDVDAHTGRGKAKLESSRQSAAELV